MPKINVLKKEIAQLIAAGEVVERPASVIKELVENSIDSGANVIEVEIKNGGSTFMRITDNGCGIDRADVKTAFLRHATSKVNCEADLQKIGTLGFRGEALASISAVAHVSITTKTKQSANGISYSISGEIEGDVEDVGCPNGTTIIVEDLFFNTPARLKFLKKDISEANAIAGIIDKIALSHPEIAIRLIRDGKVTLNTPGNGKLKAAIYSVYGREFTSGLIEVNYNFEGIKVWGYVSKPSFARANRNMQNFFINGRYVKSRTAMAAIEQAFKGSIMVGKFPSCVLHIEIAPNNIDVNVHPAKIEVRFTDEKPLFQAIYHATKSALSMKDTPKEATITNKSTVQDNNRQLGIEQYNDTEDRDKEVYMPKKENIFRDSGDTTKFIKDWYFKGNLPQKDYSKSQHEDVKSDITVKVCENTNVVAKDEADRIENETPSYGYIGEAFKSYLIIEHNDDELVLIDKHAAHERLLYEKLKSRTDDKLSQVLLEPVIVTLEKNEYSAVMQHANDILELGFEIEDFGGDKVIVRSTPMEIDNIKDTIVEIASYLLQNKSDITPQKLDWVYHNVACRAAIKAGDYNNSKELIELVQMLQGNQDIKYCPHGRPIYIVISKKEIEKQFGR